MSGPPDIERQIEFDFLRATEGGGASRMMSEFAGGKP